MSDARAQAAAAETVEKRRRVPRGLKQTGPVLLSYGFRPFFLGGALWALLAMVLWVGVLAFGWPLGGDFGPVWWHAHEMVFGFAPAVLAGFLLTAVPNWTGRLPVSGGPLAVLAGAWLAGRIAMAGAAVIGMTAAAIIDMIFLPMLFLLCAREIVAGRKWKDVKVLGGVALVTAGNLGFQVAALADWDLGVFYRAGVTGFVVLILIVGGRILPAFTRNWLHMRGATRFPVAYNRFDAGVIVFSAATLILWVFWPESRATLVAALAAAALNLARLWRWRGWSAWTEKLMFVLHAAYLMVPLGYLALALAAAGLIAPASALHVLTVGVIGCMMLAMLTRVTRGHTGRPLQASSLTVVSYLCLFAAAILRPVANLLGGEGWMWLAGLLWIAAFALFLIEYAPMLVNERRKPRGDA